jgi:hypothetical protein
MALTIKEVDNAKSNGKPYRLADGGGLCPFVAPIVAAMIIICKDPADLCADGIISLKVGEPDRLLSTCFLLLLDARYLGGLGGTELERQFHHSLRIGGWVLQHPSSSFRRGSCCFLKSSENSLCGFSFSIKFES